MDFPTKLIKIYDEHDGQNDEAPSYALSYALSNVLMEFNKEIERYLSKPPEDNSALDEPLEIPTPLLLVNLGSILHRHVIQSLSNDRSIVSITTATQDNAEAAVAEANALSKGAVSILEQQQDSSILNIENVSLKVRTAKNVFRWYSQIYLDKMSSKRQIPGPFQVLQSPEFVLLLTKLLDQISRNTTFGTEEQKLARNLAMHLFYATYSPSPGDWFSDASLKYLTTELEFPKMVLRLLLLSESTELVLALVRNIHCALVCFPNGRASVEKAELSWVPTDSSAPWAPTDECQVTYRSALPQIVMGMIEIIRKEESSGGETSEVHDEALRTISEVFNIFFILRVTFESNGTPSGMIKALIGILSLSSSNQHAFNCKQATVTMLINASSGFGDQLVKHAAVSALVGHLERQVTWVLDKTVLGDSGAAAITPSLSVLYKFCTASDSFRKIVKDCIFPIRPEFQAKVEEQKLQESGNMSPLDAPKGTLRWKLIQLMTWTESHVKRLTGELLWVLCLSDPTEFMWRTGLGNAMPILSLKGFAQMPVSS